MVIFCSALSTGCLFALWLLVALVSGAADAITIDRDLGTGVRIWRVAGRHRIGVWRVRRRRLGLSDCDAEGFRKVFLAGRYFRMWVCRL